jgi:hypothetical protein
MSENTNCPNCDFEVTGNFCANCGQKVTDLHPSLKTMFHDFTSDLFAFDSRFYRTLSPLIFKPGFLTSEFIQGRRARYVPPFRIYLFISFLLFLSLTLFNVQILKIGDSETDVKTTPALEFGATEKPDSTQIKESPQETESEKENMTSRFFKNLEIAGKDPQRINNMVVDRIPQIMFFLVPFFALLIKLVYFRSDRIYLHHLVFSLHFHAFIFLIMLMNLLLTNLIQSNLPAILLLFVPVYLFRGLRKVSQQSKKKTFAKFSFLGVFYLITLIVTLVGAGFLTIYFLI